MLAFQMANSEEHARCISLLMHCWWRSCTPGALRCIPLSSSASASYASMSSYGSSTPRPVGSHPSLALNGSVATDEAPPKGLIFSRSAWPKETRPLRCSQKATAASRQSSVARASSMGAPLHPRLPQIDGSRGVAAAAPRPPATTTATRPNPIPRRLSTFALSSPQAMHHERTQHGNKNNRR
eukprot:scaffold6532_cov116-Isochrysis_galbana.AAC.15